VNRDPTLAVLAERFLSRRAEMDRRGSYARTAHQYSSYHRVMLVPTPGKPGYADVVLVRQMPYAGRASRQPAEIVRAWRNLKRGTRQDDRTEVGDALAEARMLRDTLDAARNAAKDRP
jgi:hypothetical protein